MPATPSPSPASLRLPKKERLSSRTVVGMLFAAPRRAAAEPAAGASPHPQARIAFPVRAVWMPRRPLDEHGLPADCHRFMVGVPKKRLKRAVDRVAVRRRMREAYRLNRHAIPAGLPFCDIAFVYVANEVLPYDAIEHAMVRILSRLKA